MSKTSSNEYKKSSSNHHRLVVDLSVQRSYAFIESETNELEQIIDLLRQFFPRTKIVESNHPNFNSHIDEQLSTPTFRGKVKDYLQRRYLKQMDTTSVKSLSLDSSTNRSVGLQRSSTLDIDESSNETTKEQSNDDEFSRFLIPKVHSEKRMSTSSTRTSIPPTPYSVASDPGPFRSPWLNTPTSTFHFRFPQDQISVNAQSSISQLSTLTKMLCDEPNIHTPITPRFKQDTSDEHTTTQQELSIEDEMRNYSCQICSKRFTRNDMLNRHIRLHSGIRPYRCKMCNTQFSRSDHLSTHLRTHTGEKPYTCPHCSYAACRRDMITRHLKIHRKQRSERIKNATSK